MMIKTIVLLLNNRYNANVYKYVLNHKVLFRKNLIKN